MLTPRDKEMLNGLSAFRCLSRDQIAALYFSHLKNPVTSANYVLKRLRRDGHVEANIEHSPYVYFTSPPLIRKNSQKISHYLAIADFYIEVIKYQKPGMFIVEPRYGPNVMQPDIFMVWYGVPFFVEIQNSIYSSRMMHEKLNRYLNYYRLKSWQDEPWQDRNIVRFPIVWIISNYCYNLPCYEIEIFQSKDVFSFMNELKVKN
ncbi:replication-relaxation family protein [Aneurinibacillus tyrosinisolvens]|uniref:replication-relaxation family protein n=1 Tax=Aneurinibacillus tyrosinisolvens TaxID=1443435 RepID=UPI00063F45AC|nr:replication-relaxation family protein [Aneurinibacillus tyrosinisolvens]